MNPSPAAPTARRGLRRIGRLPAVPPALVAVAALSAAATSAAAATDPGLAGPLTSATQNVTIPVRGGATRNTDIYYPAGAGGVDPAAGRCPVVVFGHGFSRNKDRYTDFGRHLASRGFVVAIPNFRCGILTGCDHPANADEMVDVISWLLARDGDPGSIFFGRLDTARVGTSGHSAGGLQALVAASRDARVGASAPMDPVDNNGLGVSSLPSARAAVAITYSEPSGCNAGGSSATLYAAAVAQKRGVKLVGANHCDPEQDNDFFGCALTCGAWNATRHQRYLRYVTGWFEYYLHCNASYKEWAAGARVESDLAAGTVTYDADLTPEPPAGVAAAWNGTAVVVSRAAPSQCAGVDAWRVFRAVGSSGDFFLVADGLPPSLTSWIDTGVERGRTYRYVARDGVSDFRAAFESADSDVASVTTPAGSPGEPRIASVRREAGTALGIEFDPAACANDHVARWDIASSVGPLAWSGESCGLGVSGQAVIDPGALAPGSALRLVVVAADGASEGSYGRDSAGQERPAATGPSACGLPQALGPCP